MAIIKCKMCGGDLILEEGSNVAECEYCGSRQTVPSADNEKKLNLFARANRLRANNEFDKAAGVYESIVADFPEEAEAYWGQILCKYGIEYVDDPATGKKIPTCHRSSFDSVMDDPNFELVMENADPIARRVYREEAKQLEELRKGIIEVSSKEEPYDIFICYKETDDKGDRTLDSVLAQDVYDMLTENGYRVFFSRVTLEDKLGVEYEPYIFAALNSAKIMLAFGTDYDYYNAVWVKNEWSRFLQLIAKGEKKTLIPCYKNIDAYDMPKEFAKLQAQDLGKVGALQDLLRGIKKILPKEDDKKAAPAVQAGPNTAALLKRAFMFLEDGKWKEADEYCERVLDQDPENTEAYLGKLMAELQARRLEDLRDCTKPFDGSDNYKKAVRFSGEEQALKLKEYVAIIRDRSETKRKTDVYNEALRAMNAAHSAEAYQAAAIAFQSIPGFKDADDLAKQCLENAKEYPKKMEESLRIAARRLMERKRCIAEKRANEISAAVAPARMAAKEKLAASKDRIRSLTELRNRFDALLASASELQQEQAAVASQEANLSEQLKKLASQEANLSAQRTKLGIFSGKEKKRIDEELSAIAEKRNGFSDGLAELSVREKRLADQIEQNMHQRFGFSSKEEVDLEIARETAAAAELETQIAELANDELSDHNREAVRACLREPTLTIPEWDARKCIQCNNCAFVCPHAAIRPFALTAREAQKAPAGAKLVDIKAGKGRGVYKYTLAVSPVDCMGCGDCVGVCPVKSITMKPQESQLDQQPVFDYCVKTPEKKDMQDLTVKGSQFKKPLLEFSGSCAGCAETPYARLITQLFGDRMYISKATGCSSIWGGPGIHVAQKTIRESLKAKIEAILANGSNEAFKAAAQKWLDTYNDGAANQPATKELIAALEACGCDCAKEILEKKEYLSKKSVWIFGSDNIDQVLASGEDVNIFVFDNEVYRSIDQVAQFDIAGKSLAEIAISYGSAYVSQIAMGANPAQTIKAISEAEAYHGPSLIIGYAPCEMHSIDGGMIHCQEEMKKAVDCGYWNLFRFNPNTAKKFTLDSKEPKSGYHGFSINESAIMERYERLKKLVEMYNN